MTDARRLSTLQPVLADLVVSYHKVRHFHWSVSGPAFFSLHEKFEQMYLDWARWADEVAERIVALGGTPQPTLVGAVGDSVVDEEPGVPGAAAMAAALAEDVDHVRPRINAAIEAAEEAGDRTTADVLDDVRDGMDGHAWMLRRFTV